MITITCVAQNNASVGFSETIPMEKILIEITNKNDKGRVISISDQIEKLNNVLKK